MGTLSHLDELEAEAIYIMREVAAELPGKATVPIYAYRYNMEIQRNDRI